MTEVNGNSRGGQSPRPRTLRDYVAIGFRNRRLIFLSFVVIFLGCILAIVMVPPKYEAQTRILLDMSRVNPVISTKPEVLQTAWKLSEDELNTEMEVLLSRDLLQKAVVGCGLHEPDPWWTSPIAAVGVLQSNVMASLGLAPDKDVRIYKATLKLESKIEVVPMPDSNVIQVSYASPFPDRSACVLQTLNQAYLDKHVHLQGASRASEAFDEQTKQFKKELLDSQAQLVHFARSEGVVAAETEKNIAVQQLTNFEAMYQQTQASIAQTKRRLEDIRSQMSSTSGRIVTQVHTSDSAILLQNLKTNLVSLQVQRIALLERFDPTYRSVQEIDKQIAQTQTQIAEAEKFPLHDQTTDVNPTQEWLVGALAQGQADLAGQVALANAEQHAIQTYQAKGLHLGQAQWTQENLMRNVKSNEENYLLYLHKQQEARSNEILDNARISNVSIAEPPVVPRVPVGLPLVAKLFLAIAVSGVLSLGMGLVGEYTDGTVRTPAELEETLDIPVLASLSANEA